MSLRTLWERALATILVRFILPLKAVATFLGAIQTAAIHLKVVLMLRVFLTCIRECSFKSMRFNLCHVSAVRTECMGVLAMHCPGP